MPNTKSAKKRLRQNTTRKEHNLAIKRSMRTQLRKVREAVKAGDVELATTEFKAATKKLDRAGAQNIIHRNAAARLKSRMSAKIKAMKEA
jgi:small subunit ribosomal protein S20